MLKKIFHPTFYPEDRAQHLWAYLGIKRMASKTDLTTITSRIIIIRDFALPLTLLLLLRFADQ